MQIETQRLLLREMVPDDLDFVAEMLGDAEVMRFYPKRYDRAEAEQWIERQRRHYERHGYGLWLVADRITKERLGQVGMLRQHVDGVEMDEIGYLVHRPFWRRGIATEAAAATRQWAFETLGRPRIISLIRPENTPSQGVAYKLGMHLIGETVRVGQLHLIFESWAVREALAR